MITAALSVIIVLFFSPEMWDVASTVDLYQLVLFSGFSLLVYGGIVTIFPPKLMETWPTVGPAVRTLDHVKLSLFLPRSASSPARLAAGRTARRWGVASCSSTKRSEQHRHGCRPCGTLHKE